MNMTSLVLMSMLMAILLYVINLLTTMKPDINKLSPYECGFDPLGNARTPISIQFFKLSHYLLQAN